MQHMNIRLSRCPCLGQHRCHFRADACCASFGLTSSGKPVHFDPIYSKRIDCHPFSFMVSNGDYFDPGLGAVTYSAIWCLPTRDNEHSNSTLPSASGMRRPERRYRTFTQGKPPLSLEYGLLGPVIVSCMAQLYPGKSRQFAPLFYLCFPPRPTDVNTGE